MQERKYINIQHKKKCFLCDIKIFLDPGPDLPEYNGTQVDFSAQSVRIGFLSVKLKKLNFSDSEFGVL